MPDGPVTLDSPLRDPFRPWLTVAMVTYGDHLPLARRCLDSIWTTLPPHHAEVLVGANAPGAGTREWLLDQTRRGRIHRLLISESNLFKCPMMRLLLEAARGDYLWSFDDDSHVLDPGVADRWLAQVQAGSPRVVGWGGTCVIRHPEGFSTLDDARRWVTHAPWFRGLEPPGTPGNEDWWFVAGGCNWFRTSALRALDWPDPRLLHTSEDVLLGEAVRQHGWHLANIADLGVLISDAPRRGPAAIGIPRWNP